MDSCTAVFSKSIWPFASPPPPPPSSRRTRARLVAGKRHKTEQMKVREAHRGGKKCNQRGREGVKRKNKPILLKGTESCERDKAGRPAASLNTHLNSWSAMQKQSKETLQYNNYRHSKLPKGATA